jgi:hypothetical protein
MWTVSWGDNKLAKEPAPPARAVADQPQVNRMERNFGYPIDLPQLAFVAAVCGGLLLPLRGMATEPVADVQQAAAEWAKVRAETVRIESDWALEQNLMQGTLDALKEKVGQLELQRDELAAKTATERREIAELETRRKEMAAATVAAEQHLRELDARLAKLRPWLPPRLSAALELPFRSLEDANLPPAERMQHTMTILNRCTHFNQAVACGEEMVTPTGGAAVLMETVYWGLSHGYALDRSGRIAYRGEAGGAGWTWTPVPELAKQVERLIAVAQDRTEPAFVELEVQISDPEIIKSTK